MIEKTAIRSDPIYGQACSRRTLTEFEALDLAGSSFGKFGHEFDPARVLEGRELSFDERFECIGQGLARFVAGVEDNVGFRLDELVGIHRAHDGAFEHGWMRDQGGLDLEG